MPGESIYVHSALLSAVAGYVDAAGFASLVGLFPAHMTGEIVGDAIAISSGHLSEHVTRLWMLPVFVGSVATATLVARVLRRRGRRALTGLLALVTAALALFTASDYLAGLLHESWHLHIILGGACAVAAMGFQNALMRESLSGSCPTTVMTGNLTQVVVEVVDHVFSRVTGPHRRDRPSTTHLLPVLCALCAFVACATLGGFLTRFFGSLSVALPTALTALLTAHAFRRDHQVVLLPELAAPARPAPLPQFDVWPDSLSPLKASPELPLSPLKASPELPLSPLKTRPELPLSAHDDTARAPAKRTMSGTRLKTQAVPVGADGQQSPSADPKALGTSKGR